MLIFLSLLSFTSAVNSESKISLDQLKSQDIPVTNENIDSILSGFGLTQKGLSQRIKDMTEGRKKDKDNKKTKNNVKNGRGKKGNKGGEGNKKNNKPSLS